MRHTTNMGMMGNVFHCKGPKPNIYKKAGAEMRAAELMGDPEKAAHELAVTDAEEGLASLNAMRIAHIANYAHMEWQRPCNYQMQDEGWEAWVYARGEIRLYPWMEPFIDEKKGGYKPGVVTALRNILKEKKYVELQEKITYKMRRISRRGREVLYTTEGYDGLSGGLKWRRYIDQPRVWNTRTTKGEITKPVTTDARLAGNDKKRLSCNESSLFANTKRKENNELPHGSAPCNG